MRRYPRNYSFNDLMPRIKKLPNECWQWTGSLCYGGNVDKGDHGGYGKASINGERDYVHRLAYREFKGEIPEGLVIDHICRNRGCVNPDHLQAVSPGTNARRGSQAKLNPEQVREARRRLAAPVQEMCDRFGVHRQTLIDAAMGASWGEL